MVAAGLELVDMPGVAGKILGPDLPGVDHDLFASLAVHEFRFLAETEFVFLEVGDVKDQHFMVLGTEMFEPFYHPFGIVQKV